MAFEPWLDEKFCDMLRNRGNCWYLVYVWCTMYVPLWLVAQFRFLKSVQRTASAEHPQPRRPDPHSNPCSPPSKSSPLLRGECVELTWTIQRPIIWQTSPIHGRFQVWQVSILLQGLRLPKGEVNYQLHEPLGQHRRCLWQDETKT